MGRGSAPVSTAVGPDEAHQFFDEKVANVRASTADVPPPFYSTAPLDCRFTCFSRSTIDDVTKAVQRHCMSDILPTNMLKSNVDLLAPFLTELFNRSLSLGSVPTIFKAAYITPLLKKPDAAQADVKQYRPISNLSVLSKLLERLVVQAVTRLFD